MKITKDNATFFQNKFNFHIGNIETTETILIDASFIIIGNLKTSKNILAEDNIIVVGDVEAKSIYACKDLLCTGIINTEICEVEGEFKVLEKNIFEKYTKLSKAEIISNRKNEDDKNKLNKKNESTQLKKSIKDRKNKEYKRITEEKELNKGDIIIHNTLGEGKFISMSNDKIKIDFKTDGVREISKEIAFKLELLKKEIENEIYSDRKKSLSKEEFIEKIDSSISYSNKNNTVNELKKNKKYKRITEEKDLNKGDIVIHNSLGEGKFISISKDKIKIDFKIKGVRSISKDITFKLGLLKKKIENEAYNTQIKNLSKEEFINKIDRLINCSNNKTKYNNTATKNNMVLNKYNENVPTLNSMNNLYKNKSISFYIKDINSCIIDRYDNDDKKYCIHYIKYNDLVYVRLNQICDFLSINSNIIDNYVTISIKISYYGKGINGIKFINLNDILENEYCILKKLYYYGDQCLLKYKRLLQILYYIKIDADINLNNSMPYLRYVIDMILDNKKISIEELAKEWNVTAESIEFVRLGFTSPLSKIKQLIKNNKIKNPKEDQYKIRDIKYGDINLK